MTCKETWPSVNMRNGRSLEQPEPFQTWLFDQADEAGRVPVKRWDQNASHPSGSALEILDADGRRFQKVKHPCSWDREDLKRRTSEDPEVQN